MLIAQYRCKKSVEEEIKKREKTLKTWKNKKRLKTPKATACVASVIGL